MFKKKGIKKSAEIILKNEEPKSCLKYDKPKILLIDMPEKTDGTLKDQGYNVSVGSFGNPYKVPKNDNYKPIISNGNLPNVTEQEIVIIDLDEPEILEAPEGEKHTSDGENDWWASCNQGVIDPRPQMMTWVRKHFDRILNHGGLFVIFAKAREVQKMKFGHIRGYDLEGDKIDFDNWSFLSSLEESFVNIGYDSGKEMFCADKKNLLADLLTKHIKESKFYCTLQDSYHIKKENWFPLLKNKYGLTVSTAIVRAYGDDKHTWILIFPQFSNKVDFVLELFKFLPTLAPHLFPYYEGNLWLHKEEYELPEVNQLEAKKRVIKQKCDEEVKGIGLQIEKKKEENKFWYDLIRETDDSLVQAVIKTLNILGFEKVVDVDKEAKANGTGGSLREDIQIKDGAPILIVDVKGITDLPSDPEATQAHKHATMRMKEWKRTDINSLTIINHQRNIPPLDRENNMPYRQELLDGASQIDSGLMTSWDLYRLLRSFIRNNWKSENVKPLFYNSGRINIVPTHYEHIGHVKQIWHKAEAFSVYIESGSLNKGDKIGFEFPIEFYEQTIESMQLNNIDITEAKPGNEIGIKSLVPILHLREGTKVYLVK